MTDSIKPIHWQLDIDEQSIAWLRLDRQDARVNALSIDVVEGLSDQLTIVEANLPRGLVILSGKQNGFIAGADVNAFVGVSEVDAAALMARCHQVLNRLELLSCPTLSLINGFCLGGGLELALACRYRIAEDDVGTRLGLPEVMLGIHPGFGGSVRLTRLIGPPAAMDLMLSGRSVNARTAKRLGIVDYVIPKRQFKRAATALMLDPPTAHRAKWYLAAFNHRILRPTLSRYLRKQVAHRAKKEHYPAPFALIDLWQRYGDNSQKMYKAEIDSVANLVAGETAKNLIRIFFLQEQMKALGRGGSDDKIEHVHVIGAGIMGGDIAIWCALQGIKVTLQDSSAERLAPAMKRAQQLFKKRLKRRRPIEAAMDRLIPDVRGAGVAQADVIIEAIFEDIDAKQKLFKEIEPRMKEGALLATNTSSIPLETLGLALNRPERLVGIHFFNPVAKMQLVEVVKYDLCDQSSIDKACRFTGQISRLPLVVKSQPGFLVNRVLMPYILEAMLMVQEGESPELIDHAAKEFGMPMGPLVLADTVGLDICLSVGENLSKTMSVEVPQRLRELVSQGRLGVKSGQGYYSYKKGKPVKSANKNQQGDIKALALRMIMPLLNESVACLREGVVDDAGLLDSGIIFGTGFAPFKGGPIKMIQDSGVEEMRQEMAALAEKLGDRFTADDGWSTL